MHPSSLFTPSISLVIAIIAALVTGPASASNTTIRFEIDFFQNGSAEAMNQATIWISNGRVRIEQRQPHAVQKAPALVYRGDKGTVLSISDRDRNYSQLDRGMLRMLGMRSPSKSNRSTRRAVDEQLKGLPNDQRIALERVLGLSPQDAVAAPLTVEHDISVATVAGTECKRVVMARAQRPVGDACIAQWGQLGFSQTDIEVFRALANFQRDILGAKGVTPVEFVPDQAFDLIVQFDGFPLSFRRIVDDRERSAIRVRSILHLPVDETLFAPPAGYARRPGYSAFTEHLSASIPASTKPTEDKALTVPPPAQPAASPAPRPRVERSGKRKPNQRYRSISILPYAD